MSSGTLKPVLVAVMLAITIGSAVTLLYLSVDRDFRPGIVELGAALAAGALIGAGFLLISTNRHRLANAIMRSGTREFLLAGAGVAVLAASAILSYFHEGYPWPASLLGAVILFYAAVGGARSRADSG